MKRRDMIKLGAVAAGAGVGAPGCSLPRMLGDLQGSDGAAAFDAMLEEQITRLERPGLLQRIVEAETKQPMSDAKRTGLEEQDALFRSMLSTLLISQGFRDLPPETQVHPKVQERMWRHMDDIGGTVFEISDMLASLDDRQRAAVKRKLKQRPDLPMELGERIDTRAASLGLSAKRRLQLRMMMSQSSFRLQHGDPGSIIGEYVDKVERLRASSERDGDALDLSRQLGEREFWRYQHLLADDPNQPVGGAPPTVPPVAQPVPPAVPPATPQSSAPAPPPMPAMAKLLTDNARMAARVGHCQTVRFYGERVKELDPAYHDTVFARDPEIVGCKQRDLPAPVPPGSKRKQRPGTGGIRAGGYMLGIGLISGLVGAILVSAEVLVGLFALTLAVVLFGIGLIVLLISGIVYATSSEDE